MVAFTKCSLVTYRATGHPQALHETTQGKAELWCWFCMVFHSCLNQHFETSIFRPGHMEGPWRPARFPQNRLGRRTGFGGGGFHTVTHDFSMCLLVSITISQSSPPSLAPRRAAGSSQVLPESDQGGCWGGGGKPHCVLDLVHGHLPFHFATRGVMPAPDGRPDDFHRGERSRCGF